MHRERTPSCWLSFPKYVALVGQSFSLILRLISIDSITGSWHLKLILYERMKLLCDEVFHGTLLGPLIRFNGTRQLFEIPL